MRIIYLHQYFNTPDMAGATRSYEMARRLVSAGHEVRMVTTWREPSRERGWLITHEAGIEVHWLPVEYSNKQTYSQRIRAFLRFATAAARRAASLPGDVVFATSTPLTIALPGLYAARRRRVPMVFEIRDLWPEVPIAVGALRNPVGIWLARRLAKTAYRHSVSIIALAPGMKAAICANGVDPDKVTVIPNGCDFDLFSREHAQPIRMPRDQPEIRAVVYAGTMGLANGIEYIPRLAAELRRLAGQDPARFFLIGDGSHRERAERLAESLGVRGSAVVFLGVLPKRETARWVAAADASIMTYDGPEIMFRDSVSNKFFDALAAGKPVLANFSGFSTQTATAAGAGFILSRDPREAAKALLPILADRCRLRAAGESAIQLARERFSRDALATQLEAVLLKATRR